MFQTVKNKLKENCLHELIANDDKNKIPHMCVKIAADKVCFYYNYSYTFSDYYYLL